MSGHNFWSLSTTCAVVRWGERSAGVVARCGATMRDAQMDGVQVGLVTGSDEANGTAPEVAI